MTVLKSGSYTHLILDITLADGGTLGLLPEIFQNYVNLKVVIFSTQPAYLHDEYLRLRYGVQYISKGEEERETIVKLLAFLNDTKIADPEPEKKHTAVSKGPIIDRITTRERQVVHYLAEEKEYTEIAGLLGIKESTVRSIRRDFQKKTGIRGLLALKKFVDQHKL